MRLVRYLEDVSPRLGTVDEDDIVRACGDEGCVAAAEREHTLAELTMLPVVERSASIICGGLNYVDHATETGAALPEVPLLFGKSSNTLLAHDQPVLIPAGVTQQVDYEAELGVVVGRRCSEVSERDALRHVWGYTCVNDISARDLQFPHGQWFRGKSLDTFCPVGPFLTTTDGVPDPQSLRIRGQLNGQTVQDSTTANMVFSVAELISYISRTITLQPGDPIATGTPAGVGYARDPELLLQPGDTVTVEVGELGRLSNPVAER